MREEVPLYVKYAQVLNQEPELPLMILKQEASFYADFLNEKVPRCQVRGKAVVASAAERQSAYCGRTTMLVHLIFA